MPRMFPLIAALAIAGSPVNAAADWREYVYPDDRFAIQFPAEPRLRTAPYETGIASGVSARIYSVEFENILFEATVVDLDRLIEHGANFVIEATDKLQNAGEVVFHDFPRIAFGPGVVLTYGLTTVVDTKDGRRIRSTSYVANRRFYKIDAIVLPARGDKDQIVPSRFDQTLRFDVAGRN
jgi:hypothetical protein